MIVAAPGARALSVVALAAALALATGARAEGPLPGAVGPEVRGALAVEPGRIRAGDTAVLEVVVTTPPNHAVRPVAPPAELPGFFVLGAEALPVERSDGRWIHRTRFTIRAREIGQFVWPEQPVEIEAPDGSAQRLVVEGRPLEVVSVQAQFPGRSAPFGFRDPPGGPPGHSGSKLGAAAAGFAAGLASAGALALALRSRRRRHELVSLAPGPHAAADAPEALAREALAAAALRAGASPSEAADDAAAALRRWGSGRFGADLSALTTPEIAARRVAPAEAAPWRGLAAALSALDDARFAPDAARTAAKVRAAIADAAALVAEAGHGDPR